MIENKDKCLIQLVKQLDCVVKVLKVPIICLIHNTCTSYYHYLVLQIVYVCAIKITFFIDFFVADYTTPAQDSLLESHVSKAY